MAPVSQTTPLGNGHTHFPLPQSRKVFNRTLPRRVGNIEDIIEELGRRVDAIEVRPAAPASTPSARPNEFAEIVEGLAEQLRATRRRKLAVTVIRLE